MRTRKLAPWLCVLLCVACTNDYDVFESTGGSDAGVAGGSAGVAGTAGASGQGGKAGSAGKAGSSGQGGASGSGGVGGSAGGGGASGASGQGGAAGTSGAGGKAGGAGTAGAGGAAGAAGTAGAGGAAGAAGTAGTGGSAGSAGTAGSGGTLVTVEVRIQNGDDDVEQHTNDGTMYLDSSDLELGDDTAYFGVQALGLRFPGLAIPKGATIANAYIEFEVDEATNEATSVQIQAHETDNAPAFNNAAWNLTSRPTTTAAVAWSNIPAWNNVDAKIHTPDLAALVAAIVNRPGWAPPASMVFVIEGTGCRIAEAFEGEAQNAPLLHVEYVTP